MNENEFFAATTTELADGEMKQVEWNELKIIIARVAGEYYAVGGVCPHYKAPLIKGALCGTRLYCPWHHSAFDVTNGNLCEPPALDGLPHYQIRIEDQKIFIQKPEEKKAEANNVNETDNRTFVIAGGGAAGLMAAQTLRSEGFNGKLVMITREDKLPYDRPALSKKYMSGKEEKGDLPLREKDFYTTNSISVETEKTIKIITANSKIIEFTNGDTMPYDALLVATGGEPNHLKIAGADLEKVFVLRTAHDAERIVEGAKNAKKVSLIGASFIAMEVAASLQTRGIAVTVIAKEKLPFEKKFGKEIAEMICRLHTENCVVLQTEADVERIEESEGLVKVILKTGERIESDFVVTGIGVRPATGFLQEILLHDTDKSVPVDEFLQAADGLFAAGDIARFPDAKTGKMIRIEHWRLAQQHGRIAALNMLGKQTSVAEIVPFFWTNQFSKRLSYVGHAEEWDEIEVDGNIKDQTFVAFYVKDGNVLAAASMNRDKESNRIEDLMRGNRLFTVAEVKAAMM